MYEALSDLKRQAGFDIPKYGISEVHRQDPLHAGAIDEHGFLQQGSGGSQPASFTMLALKPKGPVRPGTVDDMNLIIGDIPPESRALIEGIYELVGARVMRDDHQDQESEGVVIRQGEYQGQPIYMEEIYATAAGSYDNQPTLRVRLLNQETARQELDDLTYTQRAQFLVISGLQKGRYFDAVEAHGVTRENYLDVAHLLERTRDIVDAVDTSASGQ